MKIDFDQTLVNVEGVPLTDGQHELTLGRVCASALVGDQQKDTSIADHVLRYRLAQRIITGTHEVTPEECVLMRERISKQFATPIVVGQAALMLE